MSIASPPKSFSLACLVGLLIGASVAVAEPSNDRFDAALEFSNRCATCHTVGRGDAIGPDLIGVTERRERAWLIPFIRSSQTVILSGDPMARELYERYDRTKMPDHPFSDQQIDALLELIANGGPPQAPPLRLAADATVADIAAGRDLFHGRGQAVGCAACHTVGRASVEDGMYWGGSLARTFSRYHDRELDASFERPNSRCRRSLTTEESFQLRAYLKQVESMGGEPMLPAGAFPLMAGTAGLVVIALGSRRRRPRDGREP